MRKANRAWKKVDCDSVRDCPLCVKAGKKESEVTIEIFTESVKDNYAWDGDEARCSCGNHGVVLVNDDRIRIHWDE